MVALKVIAFVVLSGMIVFCGYAEEIAKGTEHPRIIYVDGRDLQTVIDNAPPNSIVICDRNRQITLSVPVTVHKPLTLRGINARLPDKLGKTPLLIVTAEGVTISDFELHGNLDTVTQEERAPLLVIRASNFRVENGLTINSSKDGILISGDSKEDGDLVGGVVRDIVGINVARDVVSVGGGGSHGHRIRNVLVDNIRGYNSLHRGAVEVSDGADNITVRKVYAENSLYAVDVQDHGRPQEINTNVVIEDVYALNCTFAIRTANRPHGHSNLTMRDIIAERCKSPLKISNTDNVILQNIRIIGHEAGRPPISISNCDGVFLRDVTIENSNHDGPAILIKNCDDTLIDGVTLRGETDSLSSAISYRVSTDEVFSGLRIVNVSALNVKTAGIILENTSEKGTLNDYMISGNLARVVDHIQGQRGVIINNISNHE